MKSKVLQNKQQKVEKLLNSAFSLFMSKGIHETSISDITTHAGIAKGTFYLYFSDKFALRDQLITNNARKLFHSAHQDLLMEKDVISFEDKIIYIIDHIIHELEQNRQLLAFISKNLSWGLFRQLVTEDIQEDNLTGLQMFEKLAEECGITLQDPDIMAFLIVEMTSSTTYSAVFGSDPIPMERLVPRLNDAIRSIIHNHMVAQDQQ